MKILNVTLLLRCTNDHSKKIIIDDTLFLESNSERKKGPTPVCDYIYREEGSAKFYTGHSVQERKIMWDLLGPDKYELQVWGKPAGFMNTQLRDLSVECQFLVTLIILKQNKSYKECGLMFGVCPDIISKVFKTWLSLMKHSFKAFEDYVITKQNKFKKPPRAFRNKLLRDTDFVLDCTEFPCESTKNYQVQG